jgi:hypothetical protein
LKATYQQTNVVAQFTSYTKLTEIHIVEMQNVIEFFDEFQCLVDDAIIVDLEIPKCQLVILSIKHSLLHGVFSSLHQEIKSTRLDWLL